MGSVVRFGGVTTKLVFDDAGGESPDVQTSLDQARKDAAERMSKAYKQPLTATREDWLPPRSDDPSRGTPNRLAEAAEEASRRRAEAWKQPLTGNASRFAS